MLEPFGWTLSLKGKLHPRMNMAQICAVCCDVTFLQPASYASISVGNYYYYNFYAGILIQSVFNRELLRTCCRLHVKLGADRN